MPTKPDEQDALIKKLHCKLRDCLNDGNFHRDSVTKVLGECFVLLNQQIHKKSQQPANELGLPLSTKDDPDGPTSLLNSDGKMIGEVMPRYAAAIVHRVNMHGELKEILKELVHQVGISGAVDPEGHELSCLKVLSDAEALLAEAEVNDA